jgi:hypothetical protein
MRACIYINTLTAGAAKRHALRAQRACIRSPAVREAVTRVRLAHIAGAGKVCALFVPLASTAAQRASVFLLATASPGHSRAVERRRFLAQRALQACSIPPWELQSAAHVQLEHTILKPALIHQLHANHVLLPRSASQAVLVLATSVLRELFLCCKVEQHRHARHALLGGSA